MGVTRAEMWKTYEFRGHRVTVVQQWEDPFGRKMVRIEQMMSGDEPAADGMTEASFLQEARIPSC